MKIGILGGTFNPIHMGHMDMAKKALITLSLDEVWLMPCGTPPHKEGTRVLSRIHRFAMCELMCKDEPQIRVSYMEYPLLTPNYSYQTLETIKKNHPGDTFFFLMGEDSLLYLDAWKEPKRLVSACEIGVFLRPALVSDKNDAIQKCEEKIRTLKETIGGTYHLIPFVPTKISSTKIREQISGKADIKSILPALKQYLGEDVTHYLIQKDLYKESMHYDYTSIEKDLKRKLKPSRYAHTLGVCYTACSLGMRYGLDVDKCRIAGLLHDCAKYMSKEEMREVLLRHDISVSEAYEKAPQLMHAAVGKILAKETYGITDADVLHAILVHTTGCPQMNAYDEVIFISDYIEPNRTEAPHLNEIRQMAFCDKNLAIRMILKDTMDYLKEKDAYLDPATQETYLYYEKETVKEQETWKPKN